jgi:hypothetical protein
VELRPSIAALPDFSVLDSQFWFMNAPTRPQQLGLLVLLTLLVVYVVIRLLWLPG